MFNDVQITLLIPLASITGRLTWGRETQSRSRIVIITSVRYKEFYLCRFKIGNSFIVRGEDVEYFHMW